MQPDGTTAGSRGVVCLRPSFRHPCMCSLISFDKLRTGVDKIRCLFLSCPARSGIQGLGGVVIWKDAGRHVPYRLMVSVCRGGPGCPPFLSFFSPAGFRPRTTRGRGLWGFAPTRRGPFVSAKGPKTSGARAGPPRGGSCAPVPGVWAAELAALRQSSPSYGMDGIGAQPRPQAPGQRQRTTTLDPRMRKDDREKRKDDRLFLSCPTRSGIQPSVMPDSIGHPAFCHPRLRSGIQPAVMPDPDRGSRVFAFVFALRFIREGERPWIPDQDLSLTFLIEDPG